MSMLKRCLNYLKQNGVAYSHSIHRPAYTALDVASADRTPAHTMIKTVIYRSDKGYGMLLAPADCSVDFTEVCRLLGLVSVRLASESELAALFPDCEVGAMPALGNLFDLPVLLDESLATTQFIAFNGGTHQDVIHMSSADFHRLVNPLVAAFAYREEMMPR